MDSIDELPKRQVGRKLAAVSAVIASALLPVEGSNAELPTKIEAPVLSDENLLSDSGEDPWVFEHEGLYYKTTVSRDKRNLMVSQSETIAGIADAPLQTVWEASDAEADNGLWAPEQHYIDGKFYTYLAVQSEDDASRRMRVLESETPFGPFTDKGIISSETDRWAIDGTPVMFRNELYFIWSGWEGEKNGQQNLYIARMSNPWTISGDRALISEPEHDWEKRGATPEGLPAVNEGPQPIGFKDPRFVTFSASGSWTDHYALGLLEYLGGDPMDRENWQKHQSPIFESSETILAPGHASFVETKEGTWYVFYHHARHPGAGWDRMERYQVILMPEGEMPQFFTPRDTVEVPVVAAG